MRPRTRKEMDRTLRGLVRDCLALAAEAELRQVNLAALLGVSRLTVGKWQKHIDAGGSWETLGVTGGTSATTFMNLLLAKRTLEVALAANELPLQTDGMARRWVREQLAVATE